MFNYFQVDSHDTDKIINFLKENNIDYQMTRALTDFLYEEDIKFNVNRVYYNFGVALNDLQKNHLKLHLFSQMEYLDWDFYDDFILNNIKEYLDNFN